MSDHRRIDFIVMGAQKAGTTALFDHLSDDPALGLSKVKEVHFFDNDALDWATPDYGPYHDQFDWTGEQIRGEATPIYVYWPGSLERIAAYRSDIKLILMLRDPVERAWSHWRMEAARGVEPLAFAQAIRRGRQRLFRGEPWGHLRLCARDQVLVLQANDLAADPNGVLSRFNGFVGAPPPPISAPRKVHVGQDMGQMDPADRDYLAEVYAPDQARLAALLASLT